ncbi:MAG: hypothetical protein K0S07_1051 [Chlamydiales bacterium]|jgi:hypothetical protein|nr:hypothetical protein [Chlamydiales bacterium]
MKQALLALICGVFCMNQAYSGEEAYWRLFDAIIAEHFQAVGELAPLQPSLKGGGAPDGKLSHIQVGFDCSAKALSKEEMRRYLVLGALDLLRRFDESSAIRPFLIAYPLPMMAIDYSLCLTDASGNTLKNPGHGQEIICYVHLTKERVLYYIENEAEEGFQLLFEEPFREALRALEG